MMRRGEVRQEDLADYCEQLATLLGAEVSLRDALQLLQQGWERRGMQRLTVEVSRQVEGGGAFADALAAHSRYLPPFLVEAIREGELGGRLAESLAEVAGYLQSTAHLGTDCCSELRATLYYPAAVLTLMVVISTILLVFVIPQFKMLFDNFGADLPALTLLVIRLADLVAVWWPLVLGLLLVLALGWRQGLRRIAAFHRLNLLLLALVPGYGALYRQGIAARLLHTWAFLLGRGMAMEHAVAASAQLPLGPYYQTMLGEAVRQMQQGKSLAMLLTGELLPPRLVQAIAVAARIPGPQRLLQRLAERYAAELQRKLKRVAATQEILLITLIGLVIGTLVIAMYLPIFMLGEVV